MPRLDVGTEALNICGVVDPICKDGFDLDTIERRWEEVFTPKTSPRVDVSSIFFHLFEMMVIPDS